MLCASNVARADIATFATMTNSVEDEHKRENERVSRTVLRALPERES